MNEDTRPIRKPDTRTRDMGLVLGPLLAVTVFYLLEDSVGLSYEARRLAAATTLMAVWWVTEAIPLAATALIPIVSFPINGILPIEDVVARYADKLIFLFMGGLLLGAGLERWGAHRRLALMIILIVGTAPKRIVAGVMIAGAILSAFVSNTATAMMMLPIVISIGTLVTSEETDQAKTKRFNVSLLLGLAYGCAIGGIATLTGTPPNGLMAGFLNDNLGIDMTYARWLRLGVPLVVVMLPMSWIYLVYIAMPVKLGDVPGGRSHIRKRLDELGPIKSAELLSILIFAATALMWISHGWLEDAFGLRKIDDSTIAIAGALLMFLVPIDRSLSTRILTWKQAEGIPWGVLLLFGGGLALARAVTHTGLDSWIGQQVANVGNPGDLPLLGGVNTMIVFMSSITSNTATTSTMLPVLSAVGEGMGINPTLLVISAAVAASCAFMLPVATPPNAIVFSSGRISIKQMAAAGFGLNILCVIVVTLMVWGLAPRVLGFDMNGETAIQAETMSLPIESNRAELEQE
jgi:solute carrier family 13 (sodium-dependent dicarboxylate transporter), member 2/3/5